MSIAKPFTFTANTYAKASEVNADFDTVYAQVNTNISAIAQNATDIDNLENNKANINGDYSQRFAVANPITNTDAVNKQSLMGAIANSVDYISGLVITKDSGSPEDTIIVSAGSCYDYTKTVVLAKNTSTTKQNTSQGASTTYYVYVIGNDSGSSVDVLISSSAVTPALPEGYTKFRQIGYYTTDGSKHIKTISRYGDDIDAPKPQATLIETYVNGTSWYRIYSDGWIEQGGQTNSGASSVNLLKSYKNANYNINVCTYSSQHNYARECMVTTKYTNRFSCAEGTGSDNSNSYWGSSVMWTARGY